jgi:molybdate transport system permease protein
VDISALFLSLELAFATTAILLVVGLPLATLIARGRFPGRSVLEAVVGMPLVLPPTVLGYYLLVALGPRSPVGAAIETLLGHPLPFSFAGLLIASVVYGLPFAVQPFAAAIAAVDERLLEASVTLGASRFETFRRVVLPLSLAGVATGSLLAFAHVLGEFGVVLMIGGNVDGETRTLSISLFEDVQALDYASAGRTALLLLAISFTVVLLVSVLRGSPWRRG